MNRKAIELFNQFTTELSGLEHEIINSAICSYETEIEDMTIEEIYEAVEEIMWTVEDLSITADLDEIIIEEAQSYKEQLSELL